MEGNKIEFCPNDDNMLYIKLDDQSNLKYYCNLCKAEYETKNKCVFKQNYDVNSYSHKTYVNENIFEDPTLPRLGNIKCINDECPTNKQGVAKEVLYIKYSKKDMLYLYCCAVCKHKWTSSNTEIN
jgi:DNA-directed RNA polymerase subunit M/transcription elongation factor TFIIS